MRMYDKNDNTVFGEAEELRVIGVYYEERNNYSMGKIVVSDSKFKELWDTQKTVLDFYAETDTDVSREEPHYDHQKR